MEEAYSVGDELGCPAGNSALLDGNGTLTGVLGDNTGDGFESSHIGSAASTDTTVLGGGVHGNEDDVGLADVLGDIGREEEVWLANRNAGLALVCRRLCV